MKKKLKDVEEEVVEKDVSSCLHGNWDHKIVKTSALLGENYLITLKGVGLAFIFNALQLNFR